MVSNTYRVNTVTNQSVPIGSVVKKEDPHYLNPFEDSLSTISEEQTVDKASSGKKPSKKEKKKRKRTESEKKERKERKRKEKENKKQQSTQQA